MTFAELKKILETTGYPVAYSHFTGTPLKPVPPPPYILYVSIYSSNLFADNIIHKKIDVVQIELYTAKKDLQAESLLEKVLEENEIAWQSIETFIESEQLFQKIYEVRMI
ncbi:hypothetical protein HNV23_08870 [Bacillus paranthracis]|uniref:hypothetical protein n=1 Tax=Bacillus paranthracis TaxID=2026186 RepID=UPI00148F2098|nr:hypothetical protein [Bacillus paranthracis]NOP79596.1 hypothetical protein [Bacillus paranthracis]